MKHESELISVIIPCYNAEKYISETIQSVINQTHQNLEIIVIDDDSADNSAKMVKILTEKDNRIVYHFQKNRGVCASRNVGLNWANGEYILFLDSDDVIENTFLEDRYTFLEANADYGICGSEIVKMDMLGRNLPIQDYQHAPTEKMLSEILLYQKNVASIPSNLMCRRSILKSNNITFNELLSSTGDKYFLIQLAGITKCSNIKAGHLKYRIHSESMSNTLSKSLFNDNELFVELIQKNNLIPKDIEKDCLSKHYYILAVMAFKVNLNMKFIEYLIKLLTSNPSFIFQKLTVKL